MTLHSLNLKYLITTITLSTLIHPLISQMVCNTATNSCRLECTGEDVCKAQSFQCEPGYSCTVICNGKASCYDARIFGTLATDVTVECIEEDSCKSIDVRCGYNKCILDCASNGAVCDGANAVATNALSFECLNYCPANLLAITFTTFPTKAPTNNPSTSPTRRPTEYPTTARPTSVPTTAIPTTVPSQSPSHFPSKSPSKPPSLSPSKVPSQSPSVLPSASPSRIPTTSPSLLPSTYPSGSPTPMPSHIPSSSPSDTPSNAPSNTPSLQPSYSPSSSPTATPTVIPSYSPSRGPTQYPSTSNPTLEPTLNPSKYPSSFPTSIPSTSPHDGRYWIYDGPTTEAPTRNPSFVPTAVPTKPSSAPTEFDDDIPTLSVLSNADEFTNCSSSATVIDESNLLSNLPSLELPGETLELHAMTTSTKSASASITSEENTVRYGVELIIIFDHELTTINAPNILQIIVQVIHELIHNTTSLSTCSDSEHFDLKLVINDSRSVVNGSVFVCSPNEQQQLVVVLDTSNLLCKIHFSLYDQLDLYLSLSTSKLEIRPFQRIEDADNMDLDAMTTTSTQYGVYDPTPRPIASPQVSNYYGNHGDDMGLILLFIVGGLATTSLLIASLVFAFGLRRRIRKKSTYSGSSSITHSDSECSPFENEQDYDSPSGDTRSDAAALVPIDRSREDMESDDLIGSGKHRRNGRNVLNGVKEKIARIHKSNSSETTGRNTQTQSSQTSVPSGTSKYSRNGCKHFSSSITATHSYHIQTQTLSIDDYNHMGKIQEEENNMMNPHRINGLGIIGHHFQVQSPSGCSTTSGKMKSLKSTLTHNQRTNSTTDGKTFKCDVVYKYYDELYGQRPSHIDDRSITAPVRYSHKSHRSGTRSCCVVHVDEQEMWSVESQGKDRRSLGKKYNVIGPHVVDDSISNGRTLVEVDEESDDRNRDDVHDSVHHHTYDGSHTLGATRDLNESNDRQHLLESEMVIDERSTLNSTKTAMV